MRKYNWAILGCGKIAGKFASDLKHLDRARLYAAASRSESRAQSFAQEFGFQRAYGSYEEMAADPEVDVVYIATPHSHHMEHARLCLEHKKAVLCEKAFALKALKAANGNVTRAAERVGMKRPNFHTLMKKHNISADEVRKAGTKEA